MRQHATVSGGTRVCSAGEGEQAHVNEVDEREFAVYFRSRRDTVRRTAYMMCGDWHKADDHAQAAFVALHRNWRKIRDRAALDAWMRRTLTRAVVDESRRPWRRERSTAEHADVHTVAPASDEVATRQVLVDGLRTVPARQRAVLVLRFFEGLDVSETAAAMGCSEGTVKSQTARGLESLRASLGDALDDLRPAG